MNRKSSANNNTNVFLVFRNNFYEQKDRIVKNDRTKFPINELPDYLLEKIFFSFPANHLCKTLILVCKKWKSLIDKDSFWVQKCIYDKKITINLIRVFNESNIIWNPKKFYFNNLFRRNLIKNPCGNEFYNYWYFCKNNNIIKLKVQLK